MSPSLRCWSLWRWPLVHLCSFRCRLLDGSHYTRLANVRQIKSTQTPHKPLETLAFIGVSQPHDGDAKTASATATATTRHGHSHDGHVQGRHDVQGTTATPRHGHSHDVTTTATTGTDMIAYKGTCPRDITRHAKTQSHKRSNVAPCNKHPRGGVSPRHKKQGRWLSSADAECSLEHFWITRYSRSLHIFSGCNRCCTLHIVYNVPWIDVDGGEASLSHINV